MGLSASQSRLLSITARLSDLELSAQTISNAKIRLSQNSGEASKRYADALNDQNYQMLTYNNNGDEAYADVTYSRLMNPDSALLTQYCFTNSNGAILVDNSTATKFKNAQTAGSTEKEKIEHFLQANGINADVEVAANTATNNTGSANFPISNMPPNNSTPSASAPVMVTVPTNIECFVKDQETNEWTGITQDAYWAAWQVEVMDPYNNYCQAVYDLANFSYAYGLKGFDQQAHINATADTTWPAEKYDTADKIVFEKLDGSGDYQNETGPITEEEACAKFYELLEKHNELYEYCIGEYQRTGKTSQDRFSEHYRLDSDTKFVPYEEYIGQSTPAQEIPTTPAEITPPTLGLSTSTAAPESSTGNDFSVTITNSSSSNASYYVNLYKKMATDGYVTVKEQNEDKTINNSDWISKQIQNGNLILEKVVDDEWQSTSCSSDANFTAKTDKSEIAKAEAQYEAEMADIQTKDKRFDLELNNINTEHTALQTETESITKIINKNIERSFKMFDA